MNKEIIILTLLPKIGTTGVQSHFNSFAEYLQKINIDYKIITPYTYKQSFVHRLYGKLTKVINLVNKEKAIIFSREHRLRGVQKNLLKYIGDTKKNYYIYAQDPSTALVAIELNKINFLKINFICHFNISEINEYIISQNVNVKDKGILSEYLYAKEKKAFTKADNIIFPSNFLYKIVLERIEKHSSSSREVIINNFVENFSLTQNIKKITTDFLSIGTLEYRKNQEFSIKILAELHKLGFKKTLTIIGDGPDMKKLEQLSTDLNIEKYIIFLGYVKDAKKLLLNTKFLLHSAKIENFPITLLEALSCGIPICSAPVGGIPEIFQDTVEGVYLDLENIQQSAMNITTLFNEKTYKLMSDNARDRYVKNFNVENIAPLLVSTIIGDNL